jgi:hypothetical protein
MLSVVDFPAPFGPRRTVTSPGLMAKSSPETAQAEP